MLALSSFYSFIGAEYSDSQPRRASSRDVEPASLFQRRLFHTRNPEISQRPGALPSSFPSQCRVWDLKCRCVYALELIRSSSHGDVNHLWARERFSSGILHTRLSWSELIQNLQTRFMYLQVRAGVHGVDTAVIISMQVHLARRVNSYKYHWYFRPVSFTRSRTI